MYSISMATAVRVPAAGVDSPVDLGSVYDRSAEFVWMTLQRLGVRSADLEDVCHDVFLIAHDKLQEFDTRGRVNAWLFGICLRVAANYRRRARYRLEHVGGGLSGEDSPPLVAPASTHPDRVALKHEAQKRAQAILDSMDLTKRAVFVMFELEGKSCQEIADELGIAVGTVYSRLHAARAFFTREAAQSESEANDA
jgi:RNA polymerase sigma-70 factor (ECF subfamily)